MLPLRTSLLIGVLLLFLLVQGLGLHLHEVVQHDSVEGLAVTAMAHHGHGHENPHRHVHAVSGHSRDHAAAHADESAVDIESADHTSGKLPSLNLIVALAGLVLLLAPSSAGPRQCPGASPPGRRRWIHFQPLSHAPPRTG